MIQVGDSVKINFGELMEDSLSAERNTNNKDYLTYLKSNQDNIYEVSEVNEKNACPYILNDVFLNTTSFAEEELIKIN